MVGEGDFPLTFASLETQELLPLEVGAPHSHNAIHGTYVEFIILTMVRLADVRSRGDFGDQVP